MYMCLLDMAPICKCNRCCFYRLRLPEVRVLKCLFYAARGFHNTVDMQILANDGVPPASDDDAGDAAALEVQEEHEAMKAAGFD